MTRVSVIKASRRLLWGRSQLFKLRVQKCRGTVAAFR